MVTPAGNGSAAWPLLEQPGPTGAAWSHWDSLVSLGLLGPTALGAGRAGTGQGSTQAPTAISVALPYSSPK